MAQLTIQQAFDLAVQHHQAGHLREAEQIYRQVLAREPGNFDAIHLLGMIAYQSGRREEAVDLIRQAIAIHPNFPEAHSNLGGIFADLGRRDEAVASYRHAITLNPNLPGVQNNLAGVLLERGDLDQAIAAYRCSLALRPGDAEIHQRLGNALSAAGRVGEAIAEYRQAIALRPEYAEAHCNLGIALTSTGEKDQAIAAFRRAIALNPNLPEALSNLSIVLKEKGELDEAIALCRRAIEANPRLSEAHANLGNALADNGQVDEAIAAHRQAVRLNPGFSQVHSNLLFALHYHPGISAAAIAEEHRLWDRRHAEPLKRFIQRPSTGSGQAHSNRRDPDRRLRIGYVSGDFRDHPVGRFILPLLKRHDRAQFEIFCYSNSFRSDAMTGMLRPHAGQWREIASLSDDRAAEPIRGDGIDILVDLSGHTVGNRLLVFARKPAPIQVTYLGYPNTTGLAAMDYRLSDTLADPAGMTDPFTVEKLWRLPGCAWIFEPAEEFPAIAPRASGPLVFGCLNAFAKVNAMDLELWARVLLNNPGSGMLLLVPRGEARGDVMKSFTVAGVDPSRIELTGRLSRDEYLRAFNRIDVSLDPYPYHGTMTTCESLWMGVPVVTLAGQAHVSRVGVSLVSHAGLAECVAESAEAYVRIAGELAGDENRLKQLRSTMREKMRQSPLMDAARHAAEIENAYRQMWRNWCAGGAVSGLQSPVT
jgi:predicted O-linked N-acetylglucosamine transferase (SPINDLY family)